MRKRRILSVFLFLVSVYLLWLAFHLITFKSYTTVPLKNSSFEVAGAFHIHSTYSDGKKSVEQIARCASDNSLDFIVITDHGSPNYESLASEGWKEGVLVLAGSELSENRGHLVALGFDTPASSFSSKAEEAVYQVRVLGGFTVIAHPYSKVQWSWGPAVDYGGVEILNADSMFRQSLPLSLFYLPALLINPKFAFLKVLARPERNLLKFFTCISLFPSPFQRSSTQPNAKCLMPCTAETSTTQWKQRPKRKDSGFGRNGGTGSSQWGAMCSSGHRLLYTRQYPQEWNLKRDSSATGPLCFNLVKGYGPIR
jgi:hypothetical protein